MQRDIQRILIDRDAIAHRLDELAVQITGDLGGGDPADPQAEVELTLVPVLTGSIIFVADLIRRLPQRMQIHLMSVSSYPGNATLPQPAKVQAALTRLPESLAGHNVLLVDDILDSGQTLSLVREQLGQRQPDSLHTAVLLRKQIPSAMGTPVDYVGFDIPDAFVVGYGLDYDGYYRNLPEIVTLRPEVIAEGSR